MPHEGRPPRARTRNPEGHDDRLWIGREPEEDPEEAMPPVRICPLCSAQMSAGRSLCPRCLESHRRQRPRRMSRRAKVVRRLVPALVLLIGGAVAGTAVGTSADTPKEPTLVATPVSHAKPKTVTQNVEIHSQSQTETNYVDKQAINMAQLLAAMTTVNENYLLAPSTDTSGDPNASPPSSSTDTAPVTHSTPPSDTTTIGAANSPPDTTPSTDPTSGQSTDDVDGDGCSDSYDSSACVPPYTGVDNVNCSDLTDTNFASVGNDPYNLDADGDGIACEA